MLARFRKWLIFRVFLALLPIGFNVLLALAFGPPLTRSYLFGGGELLLLAVGLSGAALGDALVMRRQREAMRDALVGACFFNLGLAAFFFAVVSVGNALKQEVGYSMVVSFVLYGGAVITSGICATLAER
jgi:hypothetical protein